MLGGWGGCMTSTLLLFPTLQKWQLGFLVFSYFVAHDLPQLARMQLFLVPYCFFVFCSWRRRVSRYKQCCKGPVSHPKPFLPPVAIAVSVWARCQPNPLFGPGGPQHCCVSLLPAMPMHLSPLCGGCCWTITACRLYSAHTPLFHQTF